MEAIVAGGCDGGNEAEGLPGRYLGTEPRWGKSFVPQLLTVPFSYDIEASVPLLRARVKWKMTIVRKQL